MISAFMMGVYCSARSDAASVGVDRIIKEGAQDPSSGATLRQPRHAVQI